MGKALIAEVVDFSWSAAANDRFTFLPGYDMDLAAYSWPGPMSGSTTRSGPEASGTSGEKAALNGGLNCSILDGWWAEMYDGANGWAIRNSDEDEQELRDEAEAASLFDTLGGVIEMYHNDRPAFHERIRHAWRTLGPGSPPPACSATTSQTSISPPWTESVPEVGNARTNRAPVGIPHRELPAPRRDGSRRVRPRGHFSTPIWARRLVQRQHRRITAAHDEQGRGSHQRKAVAGQIGRPPRETTATTSRGRAAAAINAAAAPVEAPNRPIGDSST